MPNKSPDLDSKVVPYISLGFREAMEIFSRCSEKDFFLKANKRINTLIDYLVIT